MAQNRFNDQTLLDKMSSEVAPEVSPLLRFLLDNARRISAVLVLCVLAASGYGIYNWYSGKQLGESQDALGRILVVSNSTDRLARLKTFLATAPEGMKKSVLLAVAQTAKEAGDYAAAAEAWDALSKDSKDPLYLTAVLGKAENLSVQSKDAEALQVLESAAVPADSQFANLINSQIVDLAEKMGNLEKAIAVCEKLVTGVAMASPNEADFWRQKAASLRLKEKTAKS